jgi:hypothetical protein
MFVKRGFDDGIDISEIIKRRVHPRGILRYIDRDSKRDRSSVERADHGQTAFSADIGALEDGKRM